MTQRSDFPDYFSSFAENYAAARPTYPDALFTYISSLLRNHQRAWDCATGNGQAALGLSPLFKEVHATDASSAQIANAVECDNVTYSVQSAEQTDFPDNYFNAVTTAQALHWFDLDQFAAEVDRVLKPGGIIAAWVYGFFTVSPEIDSVFDAEFKRPIEHLWKPGNTIAKSGYVDIRLPFTALDVPQIKMHCDWSLEEMIGYAASWSALNRYTAKHGFGIVDQTIARLAPVWGDPAGKRRVKMDFSVRAWRKE